MKILKTKTTFELLIFLFFRAEAIKGILNKAGTAASGSASITQGVNNMSLRSTGEPTPGGNTGDKRPHLTAKELDVLK